MPVYRSPHADFAIPDKTITELVLEGLASRPAASPALIDGVTGAVTTAGDLMARIKRFAGGLTVAGHGAGHVVALMAPNIPDYATAFHGVSWAGAVVTTVNPLYTAEELRHQLDDSGADLLITTPAFLETARQGIEGTAVETILVMGGRADGHAALEDWIGPAMATPMPVDKGGDICVLPYSSGTTGLPKGVMLTHRNLVANVAQINAVVDIQPGETTLAFLPFFHIYGMQVLMNCYLARGAVLVTLPRFDLETALRLIQDHRMQRLFVAPPVVLALAKHPMVDRFDLSSLTFIMSGAAPLGADLAAACAERLGCETVQGYGMTELSPVTHVTPPGRNRAGAVGLAMPMTECRIVDTETGRDAEPGEPGELWVRGPQAMAGYLNNATATEKTVDAEGWLHTGDVGLIDSDGYLFVVDRVKELIKVSGFQVAPAELEALIVTHPDVADVAVIGMPDPETGERPVAHVVRAPGSTVTEDEIKAYLEGHVATYKQLGRVVFTDAIPKSASGKILRRLLRRAAEA